MEGEGGKFLDQFSSAAEAALAYARHLGPAASTAVAASAASATTAVASLGPAAIATPSGPVLPLYCVPPIVSLSCRFSVSKNITCSVSAASARTVHASLLPWLPAPSVTHVPLDVSSQSSPDVTVHHDDDRGGEGRGGA